jgi:hypothetical protein
MGTQHHMESDDVYDAIAPTNYRLGLARRTTLAYLLFNIMGVQGHA